MREWLFVNRFFIFTLLIFSFLFLFGCIDNNNGVIIIENVSTQATPISACGTISSSGQYYLTQNLTYSGSDCIIIDATDVELDCQGYSISLSSVNNGIVINKNNATIKNCILSGVKSSNSKGIVGYTNTNISNVSITNFWYGIYTIYNNITISNSYLYGNWYNIRLTNYGSNAYIYNNTLINANQYILDTSFYNVYIYNNTISNNYYIFSLMPMSGIIYNNNITIYSETRFKESGCINLNTTLTEGPNIIGGQYIGGNFWRLSSGGGYSLTCADNDRNGICDSPYTIQSCTDYLPLTLSYNVSSCSVLDRSNVVYYLTQDIIGDDCLNLTGNNSILDLNGYTIWHSNSNPGTAIRIIGDVNWNISNGNIRTNYTGSSSNYGIYGNSLSNGIVNIDNINFTSNSTGTTHISLAGSTAVSKPRTISNVRIVEKGTGINLDKYLNTTIRNNYINTTGGAISVSNAFTFITNNTLISTGSSYTIYVYNQGVNISYNNISQLGNNDAIYLFYYAGSNIFNNTIITTNWISAPITVNYRSSSNVFNNTLISNGYVIKAAGTDTNIYTYNNYIISATPFNVFGTGGSFSFRTSIDCNYMNIINQSCLGGNFYATLSETGYSQTCDNTNCDSFCDVGYNSGYGTDTYTLSYYKPSTILKINNGTNFIDYNSTNTMKFRCSNPPTICEPLNQNSISNIEIIRNMNNCSYKNSTILQIYTNTSWGSDAILKCGLNNSLADAYTITTTPLNITRNLGLNTNETIFCWLNITSVGPTFPRLFNLTIINR
ncbi:MAG: right-handed parallel beta-helix repeat-containing protein [Candidatus Aenigmatarchaeota archaeon]